MVDDFGWGDSGYHRTDNSPEVVTPTCVAIVSFVVVFMCCAHTSCSVGASLDALVGEGVLFNRHVRPQ